MGSLDEELEELVEVLVLLEVKVESFFRSRSTTEINLNSLRHVSGGAVTSLEGGHKVR